jgi:RNA processing factor Prp31
MVCVHCNTSILSDFLLKQDDVGSHVMFVIQEINCVNNAAVAELMRGLRSQLSELITGLAGQDMAPMSLGLSHSLSRYKLKFSPDKVIV